MRRLPRGGRGPQHRRAGDRRRHPHPGRQRSRGDHLGVVHRPGARPLQGVHHRRGAPALVELVQRPAEVRRGAAAARGLHHGDDASRQDSRHDSLALAGLRVPHHRHRRDCRAASDDYRGGEGVHRRGGSRPHRPHRHRQHARRRERARSGDCLRGRLGRGRRRVRGAGPGGPRCGPRHGGDGGRRGGRPRLRSGRPVRRGGIRPALGLPRARPAGSRPARAEGGPAPHHRPGDRRRRRARPPAGPGEPVLEGGPAARIRRAVAGRVRHPQRDAATLPLRDGDAALDPSARAGAADRPARRSRPSRTVGAGRRAGSSPPHAGRRAGSSPPGAGRVAAAARHAGRGGAPARGPGGGASRAPFHTGGRLTGDGGPGGGHRVDGRPEGTVSRRVAGQEEVLSRDGGRPGSGDRGRQGADHLRLHHRPAHAGPTGGEGPLLARTAGRPDGRAEDGGGRSAGRRAGGPGPRDRVRRARDGTRPAPTGPDGAAARAAAVDRAAGRCRVRAARVAGAVRFSVIVARAASQFCSLAARVAGAVRTAGGWLILARVAGAVRFSVIVARAGSAPSLLGSPVQSEPPADGAPSLLGSPVQSGPPADGSSSPLGSPVQSEPPADGASSSLGSPVRSGAPSPPPEKTDDLLSQAMDDPAVQTMLDVFPAEIKEVEEM